LKKALALYREVIGANFESSFGHPQARSASAEALPVDGAGGWATEDGLFAVVPAYKSLSDETFSIRFLAHETQHFADKQNFKRLESWELEYRAKLVELIMSNVTQDSTLELFCENRSPQKDSAHAYANFRVVQDVSEELNLARGTDICSPGIPRGQALRDAARIALRKDTSRRNSH